MFDPDQVYFETNPLADCLEHYGVDLEQFRDDLAVSYHETKRIHIRESLLGAKRCCISCYRMDNGTYELTHYRC